MNRRAIGRLALLLGLSVFAWAALLAPGYFTHAHDAHHSVFFLVQFDQNIRDGILWPRWGADHALGYGYPLWLLYAPLAYYVAEAFHLIGLGFTSAVKATWIVFTLWGMFGMYALARRWWGRHQWGPEIAALVYAYVPYHLVDMYVRASLAEYAAMSWFPWVVLAFDRLLDEGSARSVGLAALALGALMLTHSGTIVVFTPFLAVWVAFRLALLWRDSGFPARETLLALVAGVLAMALAAIFLVPMVVEKRYIVEAQWVHGTYNYRMQFVYPFQLLDPRWGFGYSVPGPKDGMPFQLGLVPLFLSLAACCLAAFRRFPRRREVVFAAVVMAVTIFLMLPISLPVWDAFPPAALIQFPWRLLMITAFLMAVMAGALAPALDGLGEAGALLAALVVVGSLAYVTPQLTPVSAVDESTSGPTAFETKYPDMIGITAWTKKAPKDSPMVGYYMGKGPLVKAHILKGSGSVKLLHHGGADDRVEVKAESPVTLQFYTYYFPGWKATVDGTPTPIRPEGDLGLITLDVPPGDHVVRIRMGTMSTPARRVGTVVSLVTLALTLAMFAWRVR